MNGTKHSNGAYDLNGETNMAQPEFTAEASLYVSTGHYQVQHWLGDLRLSYAAMPQQASACPTGGSIVAIHARRDSCRPSATTVSRRLRVFSARTSVYGGRFHVGTFSQSQATKGKRSAAVPKFSAPASLFASGPYQMVHRLANCRLAPL